MSPGEQNPADLPQSSVGLETSDVQTGLASHGSVFMLITDRKPHNTMHLEPICGGRLVHTEASVRASRKTRSSSSKFNVVANTIWRLLLLSRMVLPSNSG